MNPPVASTRTSGNLITIESLIIGIVSFVQRMLNTFYAIAFNSKALTIAIIRGRTKEEHIDPHAFFILILFASTGWFMIFYDRAIKFLNEDSYMSQFFYTEEYQASVSFSGEVYRFLERLFHFDFFDSLLLTFPLAFVLYVIFFATSRILFRGIRRKLLYEWFLYGYGFSVVFFIVLYALAKWVFIKSYDFENNKYPSWFHVLPNLVFAIYYCSIFSKTFFSVLILNTNRSWRPEFFVLCLLTFSFNIHEGIFSKIKYPIKPDSALDFKFLSFEDYGSDAFNYDRTAIEMTNDTTTGVNFQVVFTNNSKTTLFLDKKERLFLINNESETGLSNVFELCIIGKVDSLDRFIKIQPGEIKLITLHAYADDTIWDEIDVRYYDLKYRVYTSKEIISATQSVNLSGWSIRHVPTNKDVL